MVIQCPECRIRFKLADERIKTEGIKVRCSRCKHVFAVRPPAPLVQPAPAGAPAFHPDPPGVGIIPGGKIGEPATPFQEEPEEEKWVELQTPPSPLQASGEELFPSGEESLVETQFSPELEADRQGDTPSVEEQSGADPFGFDEAEPVTEDERLAPPVQDAAPGDFSFDEDRPEKEDNAFGFGDFTPEPDNGQAVKAATPEEFSFDEAGTFGTDSDFAATDERKKDIPVEWQPGVADSPDFFGGAQTHTDEFDFNEAESSQGQAAPAQDRFPREPPALPSGDAGTPPVVVQEPIRRTSVEEKSPFSKPAAPIPPPASRRRKSSTSGLFIFLLLLLLTIAGAGAYLIWRGGPEGIANILNRLEGQQPQVADPGQIRLTGLKGVFVQNDQAGQLFIISGQAVNDCAEARSAITVKGVLFSDKGESLLQQTVFAGNSLTEESLRQLPYAKIEESMHNQFGDSLSNLNVAPGKAIPFTIVFKDLPSNLSEFTVEIADSRPGSK